MSWLHVAVNLWMDLQCQVEWFWFSPKTATRRKANFAWMYQALENQLLPHVVSTELEDHNDVAHVVCFDFTVYCHCFKTTTWCHQRILSSICLNNLTWMFRPTNNKVGEAHTAQLWWADHTLWSILVSNHSLSWWHRNQQQGGSHRSLSRIVHNVIVYWGSMMR